MLKKINSIPLVLILFIIFIILTYAYIIDYQLGYKPCKLCIYQRIPYLISILLIINFLFIGKYKKMSLLILSLIFIAGTLLAFYHFGIEQNFFKESFACETKNLGEKLSKEQLLEQLKQTSISCKDVGFKIMGLSLAAINAIISFLLSVIFIKLFLNYGKN